MISLSVDFPRKEDKMQKLDPDQKKKIAPKRIPEHLPFLEAICWQIDNARDLSPFEMLCRYERGWRYRGVLADLEGEERAFARQLAKEFGSWIVNDV